MTETALRTLLEATGLGAIADRLLALARPMVRVYIERTDERAIPVGASKVGGCPDLPAGVLWPTWHEPLAFIGQFNLAEVAPFDREGLLPSRGLLSFFYETNGEPLYSAMWGAPPDADPAAYLGIDESQGWRVLYHDDDPATFVRLAPASQLNEYGRFPACAARFATEVTLPDVHWPAVTALGLSDEAESALIDLYHSINRGTWEEGGHHLVGFPYNLDRSALLSCEFGLRGQTYDAVSHDRALMAAYEAEAETRWQLLLQLASNDQAGMDWAGGGLVYFCIERDALRARDFSRARLDMQFL